MKKLFPIKMKRALISTEEGINYGKTKFILQLYLFLLIIEYDSQRKANIKNILHSIT